MRILTLDIGNTTVDACVFDGREFYRIGRFPHQDVYLLKGNYDAVLVSSVKPSVNRLVLELFPEAFLIEPKHVPVKTEDIQKEKVGVDRLLNIYGFIQFHSTDGLVISCGTAFVLDLVKDSVFVGGFISAGAKLRLEALISKAELIPKFQLQLVDVPVGKDTQTAVLGAIRREMVCFVRCLQRQFLDSYGKEAFTVITGGDAWMLEGTGVEDPYLLHRAMWKLFTEMS